MDKSPDAFRTISEVADWLGTPTHVLRFWESRFTQVKPVKRAGGRRYYRPKDMELLGGIKQLLHNDGMTIRGVQKLLRKEGIKHVAALSPPVGGSNIIEATADQAGIELNAVPEKVENVVPINDNSRIKALAAKHAAPVDNSPTEPERGPRGDILSGPDQAHIDATAAAKAKQPAAPKPIVADIPDDPDDNAVAPPGITGVAAALRNAAGISQNRPDPKVFGELYDRLVKLKKNMDDVASS